MLRATLRTCQGATEATARDSGRGGHLILSDADVLRRAKSRGLVEAPQLAAMLNRLRRVAPGRVWISARASSLP